MLNEELMLIALAHRSWWNFCMPEDEKKQNQFISRNAFSVYTI